jgi:hypothetical protein
MPLSEDAKAELAEAVRIVKEDKLYTHIKKSFTAPVIEPPNPNDPPKPPTDPNPNPNDPPKPPVKKGGYWGELLDDAE